MKTIGLLGGMSWESTATYYRLINEAVKQRLGGFHSAKIILNSIDFDEIEQLQRQGDWAAMATILANAARSIEAGGADFLLICTNTMHKVADEVAQAVSIPLVHIADATAERLAQDGIRKVGLLGTRFTMEQDFYKSRISDRYGIDVVIPGDRQRQLVHDVIYNELCMGSINQASREDFIAIIDELGGNGAEAVILGCTEIAMLVEQQHTTIPLYDTTAIHAERAVDCAFN
ncbi:MAG: aspartate/glutamate racemase family protein [Gammaproteobacteria bacterium]|nr:aspartate/glutamate racemase family protein [Gammaproteobacteria bacterium]